MTLGLLAVVALLAGCGGEEQGTTDSTEDPGTAGDPGATEDTFALAVDETAAAWEPSDEYERLAAEVEPDGRLSLDAALSMFALQFGELPGVPVPSGDPGPPEPGDLAIASVLSRWSELTDDQRSAVREALELEPGWEPAPLEPPTDPATTTTSTVGTTSQVPEQEKAEQEKAEQEKAEQGATTGNGGGRSAMAGRDTVAAYQASLEPIQEALERHLGPLGANVEVVTSRRVSRGPNGQQALAAALLVTPDRCRITVWPSVFPAPSGPHHTLAHELFHCYQQHWRGSPLSAALGWIQEGTAEWAAAVVIAEVGGTLDPVLRDWLGEYYMTPARPLFRRTYDAVGWLGYLAKQTGPLWDRLPSLAMATTNDAGYAGALGGTAGASLAAEWASTQAGRDSLGPRWAVQSPGLPSLDNTRRPGFPPLGDGASQAFTAGAYATAQGSTSLEAGLTKFNASPPTQGYLRIGEQDRSVTELTGTTWCTDPDGRCTCPPGTARAGQTFPRLEGRQTLVSAGAADRPASLTISGTSLEEECGTEGVCPIGTWQTTTLPSGLPFVVESGGTGTTLTVDEAGALVQDFDTMEPVWAHDADDPDLRSFLDPSGVATGRVRVPTGGERIADEPIRDADPSGLGGTGRVEYRGELALELGPADVQAIALAGQGYGEVLLSCVDDDTLTLSGGGIVYTYERVS